MNNNVTSIVLPQSKTTLSVGDVIQYSTPNHTDRPETVLQIQNCGNNTYKVRTTDNSHPRDMAYTSADLDLDFYAGRMTKLSADDEE